jgi:hypothetical protein
VDNLEQLSGAEFGSPGTVFLEQFMAILKSVLKGTQA